MVYSFASWSFIFSYEYEYVNVNFILQQTMQAQRGVDIKLYSFLNFGARWGGWSTPRPGRFTPENDPVPIV
jgi:hypothetical protein